MTKGNIMYSLWNDFVIIEAEKEENKGGNPKHYPAGSPKGGQFAPKDGGFDISPENADYDTADYKNPSVDSISEDDRQMRINTIKSQMEGLKIDENTFYADADYEILSRSGWKETGNLDEKNNSIYEYSEALQTCKSSDLNPDEDIRVIHGDKTIEGKKALTEGGYQAKYYYNDDNSLPDAPSIFGSGNIDSALYYTSRTARDIKKTSAITFPKSVTVTKKDLERIRSGFGNHLRNLTDATVAKLAGYDVIHNGGDDQDEYIIINPSVARIIKDK